jgi:hypothetical protein
MVCDCIQLTMRPLSLSQPDLAPRTSQEWQGWHTQYQAQQAAKRESQQEQEAAARAARLEKKRREPQYRSGL